MAEQDSIPTTNGDAGQQAAGDQPQVAALAQYIKDLSVENPSSPQVFQWQEQPQLDVQFNINISKVGDDLHEVVLKIDASAKSQSGTHFIVDLSYAGLFAIRNVPDDALQGFLLIDGPRLLFPFARQIIAGATQDLGFPPLMLDPIDFAAAFMAQMEQQQQAQPGGALPGEPTVQ